MKILYPLNPLNRKEADEPYAEEYGLIEEAGFNCSLFDFDTLSFDHFKSKPNIEISEPILYRGWMLV